MVFFTGLGTDGDIFNLCPLIARAAGFPAPCQWNCACSVSMLVSACAGRASVVPLCRAGFRDAALLGRLPGCRFAGQVPGCRFAGILPLPLFRGLGTAKAFHKFVPLVFLNIPEILGTAADFVWIVPHGLSGIGHRKTFVRICSPFSQESMGNNSWQIVKSRFVCKIL